MKPADPQPPPELWRLTFRPLASPIPSAARVRKLLKIALRSLDLRCVAVEEPRPETLPRR